MSTYRIVGEPDTEYTLEDLTRMVHAEEVPKGCLITGPELAAAGVPAETIPSLARAFTLLKNKKAMDTVRAMNAPSMVNSEPDAHEIKGRNFARILRWIGHADVICGLFYTLIVDVNIGLSLMGGSLFWYVLAWVVESMSRRK